MLSTTLTLLAAAASLPFTLAQDDSSDSQDESSSSSSSTTQSTSLTSSKRGLCYVDVGHSATDDSIWDSSDSDLTWYYNYEASPTEGIDESVLEFVPMLWGTPDSDSDMSFYNTVRDLQQSGQTINYVLGFNEPDGCVSGGSCIPAEDAATTWIREIEPLKNHGISLGAPAVTGSPNGFVWLQSFFTACAGQCSADFIPVHWYGDFQGLTSHMGQVNATYPNMTMWITEYACADCELEEAQEFYNQSAEYFDRQE